MKYVIAVIQLHKLDDVRDALGGLGIEALTVDEVRRFGLSEEHEEIYRAAEYKVGFMPKMKVEFAVSDELSERAIEILRDAAVTGEMGDGRIFVFNLEHTVQIRSGKLDVEADAL